jgi:hypothetical protein
MTVTIVDSGYVNLFQNNASTSKLQGNYTPFKIEKRLLDVNSDDLIKGFGCIPSTSMRVNVEDFSGNYRGYYD